MRGKVFLLLFVIFFIGFSSSAIFYDQGTNVVNSTGDTLDNGTIEIYIYDSSSGGNLIYNKNFTNNITNGSWNVKIEPDLEYGKIYYKDYVIEGDNLNFSGSDRIEFQSPFGLINNVSFINFSLIGSCASGSSIRQIYENGSVVCETDDSGGSVNLTNYALTNESEVFDENITVTNYGFFGWVGSLISRVGNVFANNVNTINLTLNGTTIESWDDVNVSGIAYSHLSNFTNDMNYWNDTYATFNKTYADTLYNPLGVISNSTSWNSSGAYVFLANESAYAGIGTSSPLGKLGIRASGSDYNLVWEKGAIAGGLWIDSEYVAVGTTTGNDLAFFTNGGTYEMLLENGTGNLGVGTVLPQRLLHVAGDVLSNDTINATGDICIEGGVCLSSVGNVYLSKYSSGNFNGSLYTKGADSSLSNSNSIFQVIGSDGTPRLQIQNGGNEQASFVARSFMVVNQNNTRLNQSQNDLCSEWGFNYIDCNTSTTGADMGVQDDFEAQGLVYYREGLYGETSDWGAYAFMGNLSIFQVGGVNGTFSISNNYFCDYVSSPFSSGNEDDENWIKIQSGDYEGAVAEISVFVNSSCVRLSDNPSWDIDLSDLDFVLIQKPVFSVLDGNLMHSHLGNSSRSKFKIDSPNGTSSDAFEINDVAGTNQRRTLFLETNSFGFDSITTILSRIYSTVTSDSVFTSNLALEFISTNFNNSDHSFIDASIVGDKASGVNVDLITVSGDYDSYIKSSSIESIVKAYYDNGVGSTTDVTASFLSSSSNVTLFENDNSIIYVGGVTNFTDVEVVLDTLSSADIGIVVYYCNNSFEWETYSGGLTDSTNGFTSSGIIGISNPADRGTCNQEIDGTAFSNSTNYTYFAIQRTRNNLVTSPVELTIDISGASASFVLADDYIKLTPSSTPPFTCSSSYDGAIYYDSDVKFHCSCKSGAGWVQMNDYTTGCS